MVGLATIVTASALLFVFSIITTRISSQNSVAPNAPDSQPQAARKDMDDKCERIRCGIKQTCVNGRCINDSKITPTPSIPRECKVGINTWTPGKTCSNGNIRSGVYTASYNCYNSKETFTVSAKTCTSNEALKSIAQKRCLTFTCGTTPTPTKIVNNPPRFTNTQILSGAVGKSYYSDINAIDDDKGDTVTITVQGLPAGFMFGPCAIPTGDNKVTCSIQGTPTKSGYFTIYATATDTRGGVTKASFGLSILNPTTPTPMPRQ